MLAMKFHEKLEQLCQSRHWTQKSLLEAIADPAIKKSSMSNWFNGKHKPDLETGLKIARALGVSLEYLADDAQDDPPASEFSESEQAIIDLVRAMGLDRREATRRLTASVSQGYAARTPEGEPFPAAGPEYPSGSPQAGRSTRRKKLPG